MAYASVALIMILIAIARIWRAVGIERRSSGYIPPSAPGENESIETYDRRMSGADIPDSPKLIRLRKLNTYPTKESQPARRIVDARRRQDGSEALEGLQEREGYGGRE